MPFKVLFYSLISTNSISDEIDIFILHTSSLGSHSIRDIAAYLSRYNRSACFLDATHFLPSNLPISEGDHVTLATYYRLFVAEIIPHGIDQAVYLDIDMLVVRSIASLFIEPVQDLIAAADHCAPTEGIRLWGDCGGNYFQAGVLVIPLDAWRRNQVSNKFLEVLHTQKHRIKWWDQDVLNITLADHWQRLPIWFNTCQQVATSLSPVYLEDHARVIHYNGSQKPWNTLKVDPLVSLWDGAYVAVFGKTFDRSHLLPAPPPHTTRLKHALKSRILGLIYGRQ